MRVLLVFFLCGLTVTATDSPRFRGPTGDGIYPEKGLLKSWPANGPTELWFTEGLGKGYGSVAIDKGTLFVTGQPDKEAMIFAYSLDGKQKWKQSLGEEHAGAGFPGTRSTPTIVGDHLYVMNGYGVVYCLDTKDGSQVWKVELAKRFDGVETPYFGFSESILVLGDMAICTPGGTNAVVALNRKNGETVWQTEGFSDKTSYCTARLYDNGKVRQIITLTAGKMVGINPKNGKVIWTHDYKAQYDIHAVSPVFQGNLIFVSDGYKQGSRLFELAADGSGVTEKWADKKLDIHHGGAVLLDGYVYGSASNGVWMCLKLETGEIVKEFKAVGKGSVIAADGKLIGYGEKGQLGLFEVSPGDMNLVSSTTIERGDGQHWAHPVIHEGRLYIRHGDALMAFQIADKDNLN